MYSIRVVREGRGVANDYKESLYSCDTKHKHFEFDDEKNRIVVFTLETGDVKRPKQRLLKFNDSLLRKRNETADVFVMNVTGKTIETHRFGSLNY